MANLRKGTLDKVKTYLNKQKYSYEVVIVDDGSDDGSREFASDFVKDNPSFTLLQNDHMGKAGAVTAGVLKASGDFVLFTDMDQATPIEELEKLIPYTKEGYDVIIGSRSIHRKGSPFSRMLMSRSVIVLRKIIVGLTDISDTQCGFKMFERQAAKKIFTRIHEIHHGFKRISGSSVTAGFDVEVIYLAKKMGYKIKEIPVNWLYVETRRVSPIRDSIEGLTELIKIRVNDISGIYD